MSFRSKEFKGLNDEFNDAATPILEGTDSSLVAFENLIDCYNTIIKYAEIDYDRRKLKTKEQIEEAINVNRVTLQRCYEKLGIPLTLPGKLLSTIHYLPSEDKPTSESSATQTEQILGDSTSSQTDQIDTVNSHSQTEQMPDRDNPNDNNTTNSNQSQNQTMDKAHFLKLCGSQINYTYSGDPLTLQSFTASIDLLKEVGANFLDTLKFYVLTRLSGKAQECVRKNPKSVDEIIEDLKAFIKPDDSKIIESRIQALRFNTGKPQEFTQQAEELAEALQRTLILEGVGQEKARKMTVERTVDLCRQSARSEFVRGIIAAAKFETPKDVLASFIVENCKEKTEKQILTIRQNNRTYTQNRQSYGRGRGNSNNFNGNRQRNYSNNYNNGYNGNNNQNNFNNNNSRNYRRGNRNYQQNQRGRGGYRNNHNNYNNNNNNDRYVRVVAENYPGPSNGRAEPQTTQANQPTILHLAHNNQ